MSTMCLYQISYTASLTRRHYNAYSWYMIVNGKAGGVVIPLLIDATPLRMLYLMKRHCGGHKKLHYQDLRTKRMTLN